MELGALVRRKRTPDCMHRRQKEGHCGTMDDGQHPLLRTDHPRWKVVGSAHSKASRHLSGTSEAVCDASVEISQTEQPSAKQPVPNPAGLFHYSSATLSSHSPSLYPSLHLLSLYPPVCLALLYSSGWCVYSYGLEIIFDTRGLYLHCSAFFQLIFKYTPTRQFTNWGRKINVRIILIYPQL